MPPITRLFASSITGITVLLFTNVVGFRTEVATAAHPKSKPLFPPTIRQTHRSPSTEGQTSSTSVKPIPEQIRIDRYENSYQLKADYTYTQTSFQQQTLLTLYGVEAGQRATFDYYPDSQSLVLLEAYVIQPDGRRINVPKDGIFTRPTAESEEAPGFTSSMTTTVVFPQLQVGSQTVVKWKLVQTKPFVLGFNVVEAPAFEEPTTKATIKLLLPATLKLHWQKRGAFVVTDTTQGKQRTITAVIEHQPAQQPENAMVESTDFSPLFVATSLPNWEAIGAIYWQQSRAKVAVTPAIQALAHKITGQQTGLAAARAIYNWVAQNIHYVDVSLDESSGYIPHTASEILRNGYGDCKDHVALMQTLLAAKGIQAYPVLVNAGMAFQPLPLWASWFNHAMIYLPQYKTFANPTNQFAAFGELDDALDGHFVVIATPTGQVAHLPKATAVDNRYLIQSTIALADDGTVTGQSELKFFGSYNSWIRGLFSGEQTDKIVNNFLAQTPEGGSGSLETSELNDLDQTVVLKARWRSPFAVNMGQQVYMTTPIGIDFENSHRLRGYITKPDRLYPLVLGAKSLRWEYKITLPTGYRIKQLPDSIEFSNSAGQYSSHYEMEQGAVRVQRLLSINSTVYSAEAYPAVQALLYKPINDVRQVMVLEKGS